MKNLQNLLLKGLIICSIVLFISCSNDDDGNRNVAPSIYGEWKYIGYVENGEYYDDVDECESGIITINQDNTGTIVMEDCDFGTQTAPFTWQNVSGNQYNLTAFGITSTVFITFPSGNDIMHITEADDSLYTDVYQRQ